MVGKLHLFILTILAGLRLVLSLTRHCRHRPIGLFVLRWKVEVNIVAQFQRPKVLSRHLILVVAFIIALYLRSEVLAWMVAVCLVALLSREGIVVLWGGLLSHCLHQGLRFLAQVGRFT